MKVAVEHADDGSEQQETIGRSRKAMIGLIIRNIREVPPGW